MSDTKNFSIFDFDSVDAYLQAMFQSIKEKHPAYSMRQWTKKLGVSDSGTLSRVLSGERKISTKSRDRIVQALGLDNYQKAYFEILALGRDGASSASREVIRELLRHRSVDYSPK